VCQALNCVPEVSSHRQCKGCVTYLETHNPCFPPAQSMFPPPPLPPQVMMDGRTLTHIYTHNCPTDPAHLPLPNPLQAVPHSPPCPLSPPSKNRYCWLDGDNCVMVDLALLNMETGQFDAAYPDGYWQFIAGVRASSFFWGGGISALWVGGRDTAVCAWLECRRSGLGFEVICVGFTKPSRSITDSNPQSL
jgi:hypothetical protein